jgi:GNS1/SUR4 family
LVVANSFVHVLMYYYYSMATMGRTVWWKKYITQAQIVQFIIDLTATWPYPFLYFSAAGCSGSMRGWFFGQAVGLSFFKLFRDFYVRSYESSRARKLQDMPIRKGAHSDGEHTSGYPPDEDKSDLDDSPRKTK